MTDKVTLYIQNNADADIPIAILGNPGSTLNNAGAVTKYKWNLTGLSFINGNVSSIVLPYRAIGATSFTNFTYTGPIATFAQLLAILNGIGSSAFYQLTENGLTYLATSTEGYVYGHLQLNPALSYDIEITVSTSVFIIVSMLMSFSSPTNVTIAWGDGNISNYVNQNGPLNLYDYNYELPELEPTITVNLNTKGSLTDFSLSHDGNINSINNFAAFTALVTLDCSGNFLVELPALPATIITLNCANNYLESGSVNAALIQLDGYGLLTGNFNSILQSGFGGAPPTGLGITAKNNLVSKGWTVTTD